MLHELSGTLVGRRRRGGRIGERWAAAFAVVRKLPRFGGCHLFSHLFSVTFSLALVAVTLSAVYVLLWPAAFCGDNVKNPRAEIIW
jgi:hypothetical protein